MRATLVISRSSSIRAMALFLRERPVDRVQPAAVATLPLIVRHARSELLLASGKRLQIIERAPQAHRQTGQPGRTDGGEIFGIAAHHGPPEKVRLKLHEVVVARGAAIGAA